MSKNKIFYILGISFCVIVIISILVFLVMQNNAKQELYKTAQQISEEKNTNVQQTSSTDDKNIQQVEQENVQNFQEIIEKQENNNTPTKISEVEKVVEETTPKTPTFVMPVEGEIIKNYAKDRLVYSDTLKEWVTHSGIDIKAPKTSVVKASSSGKVTAIKNDPRFGLSVVIEHSDGYSTVYSNLLTAEFVSVGEDVEQGETIGTVGNTAAFEILDEPHVHFEILKDSTAIDPNMYL